MSYDLNRFSTQSFERFVQALAASTLGARVQIFGAGRDGAREATYNGHCKITDDDWNGYLVIQAKYHAIPESPSQNADWLVKQIDQEMAKFSDKRRALRRPEYYLLASNVRLSASAANNDGKGEGGIDKVTKYLKDKAATLGIKDVHLWHADTLGTLIDVHEEVRTAFSFWVQPGDVLASLLKTVGEPRHEDALFRYLRSGIRQSRDIKTRDAGQTTGRTLALDDVFIDLPIAQRTASHHTSNLGDADAREDDSDAVTANATDDSDVHDSFDLSIMDLRPRILASLMEHAADKFDLFKVADFSHGYKSETPLANRIVLLGGPGQGKSTVGQFMSQLCRARLLKSTRGTQAPEIDRAVQAILQRASAESIPLTGPLRYPIHVELPRFADMLSEAEKKGDALTVLSYVARQVAKVADEEITGSIFRRWLAKIPSVIILDGLDEIPHSANRANVIFAIEELLDAIHEVNADSLIFATSRPQGYQDELSPRHWAHWTLEPLQSEEALEFARRLAPVIVADEARREEIIEIMREAADDGATSPLMVTPLQVMLLFQLVTTHNNIPKDRWTLFHRHYETLRDREIAKSGTSGQIIGKYKSQIDRIHYDAGYLLHVRAETAGGANSFLTLQEFSSLVEAQLARDGFDDNLVELTSEIVKIATDRLVFLGCRTDGQVAFDVRSLQEFMAAARITTSPEGTIRDRLYEIAGRAHWLHVFKIACSKIYASASHEALRDTVIALLNSLDAGDRDPDDQIVKTGAVLAGQLLLDGLAITVPVYRRKLISRVLRLLSVADDQLPWQLARFIDSNLQVVVESGLTEAFSNGSDATKRSVLRLLAIVSRHLDAPSSEWAQRLLLRWWPNTAAGVLSVFDSLSLLPADGPVASRLTEAQWQLTPQHVLRWVQGLDDGELEEINPSEAAVVCQKQEHLRTCALVSADGKPTDVIFIYASITERISLKTVPSDTDAGWKALEAVAAFLDKPSSASLGAFLRRVAELNMLEETKALDLPWVLKAMLMSIADRPSLFARANEAENGVHGDAETWIAAEDRWTQRGIKLEELSTNYAGIGIPRNIHEYGAPFTSRNQLAREHASALDELLSFSDRDPNSPWKLALLLSYVRRTRRSSNKRLVPYLLNVALPSGATDRALLSTALLNAMSGATEHQPIIDRLSELGPVNILPAFTVGNSTVIESLIIAFNNNIISRDFLPLIAGMANSYFQSRRPHTKIDASAFEIMEGDSASVASSVAQLRIAAGQLNEDNIGETSAHLIKGPAGYIHRILRAAVLAPHGRDMRSILQSEISRTILTSLPNAYASLAYKTLKGLLEAKRTSLSVAAEADRLGLPSPGPVPLAGTN